MPISPVTGFSIIPGPTGSPNLTLEWTHATAHRFEVLYRFDGETEWQSHLLDLATIFGVGPDYELDLTSPDNVDWVVRALNAAGEVSA